MGKLIKQFQDGSFLEYDKGSFDSWCVYLTKKNGSRRAPKDSDYFNELKSMASVYGVQKVYDDYVCIYEMTGTQVEERVFSKISAIADSYGQDALPMDILFSVLYMAMIAEEQRANTRLGKRIKRLGIHVMLIEGYSVSNAATFMTGMGWRDIDKLCRERGF